MLINANDRRDNVVRIVSTNLLEQEYAIRDRVRRRRKGKDGSERESTEGDREMMGDGQREGREAEVVILEEVGCADSIGEENIEEKGNKPIEIV